MFRASSRSVLIAATVAVVVPFAVGTATVASDASPAASLHPPGKHPQGSAVFFASDGLRQDLVERYAAQGVMPTMRSLLRNGVKASGNGLLTQAPPNTGAGWYTLATGAWPGVHGSTNNTFHKNGDAFTEPDGGVRPGRPAGRVDRPVRRARRPQGRPGRVGRWRATPRSRARPSTSRPSTPGAASTTNFIGTPASRSSTTRPSSRRSDSSSTTRPGTPGRRRSPAPPPSPATGWTDVPASYSPAQEMRMRVLDSGTDKYGLNAYIYDSTDNGTHRLRPGAVLDRPRTVTTRSATCARASGPT